MLSLQTVTSDTTFAGPEDQSPWEWGQGQEGGPGSEW